MIDLWLPTRARDFFYILGGGFVLNNESLKPFKTYAEQIEILKSRGVIMPGNGHPLKVLMEENYYNVINGYKDLFLDKTLKDEKYLEGTTFEEIYALYRFDKELRHIFLKELLKIENKLRSLISYNFSAQYGSNNYLLFDNFDTLKDSGAKIQNVSKRASHINQLIASIQGDLVKAIENKQYVNHYMLNYGFVPLWVLVNCITFGTLSKFYSLMKSKEKNEVAKYFKIKENDLEQFIKIMAVFRNLCAHDERLYNIKLDKVLNMPDTMWHDILNIEKTDKGRYINGTNDLYSLIIILRLLSSHREFNHFYNKMSKQINILKKKLKVISIDDVFEQMGFPSNWRKIKNSPRPA